MSRLAMLSQRERRVVLAGGVVLLAAVVTMRVVPAWLAWLADARAVANVSVVELSRARAGIAAMPVLRDSLAAHNERYLGLAPNILTGASPGVTGATLASVVSAAATGAGLELGAVSIRVDTSTTTVFSRPSIRGDARGDVAGLTLFLATLERGPTILVIRLLSATQPEPGAPGDRAEMLRIEFIVEGVALERPTTEVQAAEVPVALPARIQHSVGKTP